MRPARGSQTSLVPGAREQTHLWKWVWLARLRADLLTYGQTIWATQNKPNETEESSRGQLKHKTVMGAIIQSWWFNSEPPDEECVAVVPRLALSGS